jgi:hypothetical protein
MFPIRLARRSKGTVPTVAAQKKKRTSFHIRRFRALSEIRPPCFTPPRKRNPRSTRVSFRVYSDNTPPRGGFEGLGRRVCRLDLIGWSKDALYLPHTVRRRRRLCRGAESSHLALTMYGNLWHRRPMSWYRTSGDPPYHASNLKPTNQMPSPTMSPTDRSEVMALPACWLTLGLNPRP